MLISSDLGLMPEEGRLGALWVEGNKEDAGSLGQLLLVLLSWLLPVWLCIEHPLPALSNRSRLGWTGYPTCSLPGC